MRRLLLFLLLAVPAVQARDLESSLAATRQRLRSHPLVQRKLSALHHRAGLVSGTLAETSAALDQLAREPDGQDASRTLGYLRERLRAVAGTHDRDFAAIEAKLARLGLPEKTEAWREFVHHYRTRLAEVDAELASLAATAGSLSGAELRARIAALRARFGSARAEPLQETVRGTGYIQQPPPEIPAVLPTPAQGDAPTPADLAETRIVLLTPEIRTQAQALGGNAGALNTWVATRTEYVPYLGQMQNSLAVLQSGRGNDFDQATLLIALLRASGIPARYVGANAVMSRADVRDWMGVKDETLILGLLSRGLGYSLFPSVERDQVVATRVWVEAYLDTGSGKRWMVLDPARKRRSYQPGIVVERPPYDRMAYLRALKPIPPAEPYLDALRAEFHNRYPGRGFNEAPYTGTLLPPPAPAPDPPHPVVRLQFRSSEVPTVLRHRINLSLTDYGRQTRYLSVDLSLPEMVLQSLSLVFLPATAADRQVVEAFGGLKNAPAAVVNLIPEIRLQGQAIATGKTPVATGAALDLTVTHIPVAQGTTQYANHNQLTAGETAAVVLGAHQVSEELLTSRISSFLDRLPSLTAAQATSRLLDVAAMRYLHRLEIDKQRLSDFLQVRFLQAAGVENAITFASLEAQNLFDRPFVVTPGRLRIHANPTSPPLVDLNRSDQNDPVLKLAWQLHNDASSALEHEVWEELVMIPSVSTIKILQTAIRENVPILMVNRDNAADLRGIEASADARQGMQQAINAGATLTVAQRPVTIGSWRGQGWIEEDANTWNNAYRIEASSPAGGGAPGGDTGGTPPAPRPPQKEPGAVGQPGPVQNTTCSDPVNVANGNLFDQTVDFSLRGQGPGIIFQRTYNSLSLAGGPMGPGWRHNYQVSLKDSGASVAVVNESGGTLDFPLVNGVYVSPPGYNLTLTKDSGGYLLRSKSGRQSRFDQSGVLQSITDRNQNTLQLAYAGDRLRQVTDRAGRGITLSYDGQGRITSLQDFTGRRVSYEYDAAGHLASVTDLAGNRTQYAYYTDRIFNHLLQSVTTPEGRVTAWEYYGNGKVSRVTNPDGRTVNFLYLPLRNETHVIDPQGLLTSFQYNALGNVVREIRPDGSYIDSGYSADAKLESRTNAAGYTTRLTYDAGGNVTSVIDPLGRTVRFTYDPAFHQVTSIQDPRGNLTRFEYDTRGNLTRMVQPLGVETRFTWDDRGNWTSLTDAEGNTLTLTYDQLGNPTEVRDALGSVSKFEFDRLSRMTRTLDALGGETRLVDPLGRAAGATYDREGRLAQGTDFGGRTTRFSYDRMSHLTQVADALNQLTQYAYATPDCGCPASSNLVRFRDSAGFTRSQAYDFDDRLVETTDALGNQTQYSYDARGNLARKLDANGNTTTFEYDAAGQLTRKAFSDGAEVRFSYDPAGSLLSVSNPHSTLTFTYDELNRVTSVTDLRVPRTFSPPFRSRSRPALGGATDSPFQKTIRYSHDRLGRRAQMTDPAGGITRYTWDANHRLVSLTAPSGAAVRFAYDAGGRLTAIRHANGAAATRRYDAAGRVTGLAHAAGTADPWISFTYTYDGAGNLAAITGRDGSQAFQYDELDRLVRAQRSGSPAEVYAYDAAGNRTRSALDPAYRYDAAGRLAAAEGATFVYDKNGNLTSKTGASGKTTYTWDIENRLVRVELPDGGVVSYKYDPFGRRIEKNVNGTVTAYLYDGNAILEELDAAGQVTARYTHGPAVDWPLVMEREGQTFFYHADALGSVVALTDSSGNVVHSYAYDSWGRPQGTEAAGPANPFLFAGREYDVETGLYYLRARYYDPATGRFISSDPLDLAGLLLTTQDGSVRFALLPASASALARGAGLGLLRVPQQLNPYSYALNNPVAFRDPSGLKCGVYVIMGSEPWRQGAAAFDPWLQGKINDFQGWLNRNNYSLYYTEGPEAEIRDSSGNVVGTTDVSGTGYTERPYTPYLTWWQGLAQFPSQVWKILVESFQASLKVPWHQLHGQEYWDAANNPENYVKR